MRKGILGISFLLLTGALYARDLSSSIEELISKGKLDQAENLIYSAQAEGEFSPMLQIDLARISFLRKDIKNAYEIL
ncbi:MAG TPA: hypothetical protein PKU67_07300, partial [Candidatus Hydrothermia bacterium]|nr:hypothetical protein [Candidatus Hydrothermia bacterium]HOL24591.1 hypothetical protein [Candidatus Hydrothermia bacterium]HPO79604.1 hypothetical protein [Candidatus Hydrothermia bacterium]